jgi:transcription-repair coupling factor (superfamily II helicase)
LIQANLYDYISNKNHTKNKIEAILTSSKQDSNEVIEVLKFLKLNYVEFPEIRTFYKDDLRTFRDEFFELFVKLNQFYEYKKVKKKFFLVAPFVTVAHSLPSKELIKTQEISFADTINIQNCRENLVNFGYTEVEIVREKGEFLIQHNSISPIIDIFPVNFDSALRIRLVQEKTDFVVESIKKLNIYTQITSFDSQESPEIEKIDILSATLVFDNKTRKNEILELIQTNMQESFEPNIFGFGFWFLESSKNESFNFIENLNLVWAKKNTEELDEFYNLNDFDELLIDKNLFEQLPEIQTSQTYENIPFHFITVDFLQSQRKKEITLLLNSENDLKYTSDLREFVDEVIYTNAILNIYSDEKVICSYSRPLSEKEKNRPVHLLDEFQIGDFVVHEDYGIGIFEEMVQIETLFLGLRDFLKIRYANDSFINLPVENLDYLSRFISNSTIEPKLDSLGKKSSFSKKKIKTLEEIEKVAKYLIELSAERKLLKTDKIPNKNSDILNKFQKSSGFDYTKDQIKSIKTILNLMASPTPMEHLLIGDVGFGKTEIALNIALNTIKNGFQVALIVPTSILANQHFKTAKHRLSDFNIKIAQIDRFIKGKEKKELLTNSKAGQIDLLIGTHAVFSVEFKKLGLLILDEEHKFGVKQKEKLVEIYKNVHTLSMSATPIPRTMSQVFSEIKTSSNLETPPVERKGTRSFLKYFTTGTVKEAINRELRRNGQIYYVFNSIKYIEAKKLELERSFGNILKVVILHSQVSAKETEERLLAFQSGEYHVLLATTIIASGIHIPNVNTIIIENAQNFGIADLHQLRGRVGRGSREGYCYFFIPHEEDISEKAEKRLTALYENSKLGSGSVLAQHDLNIRGAGNLVGEDQSGHQNKVGYTMYLKMLEDKIQSLLLGISDDEFTEQKRTKKINIMLKVQAYISKFLVSDESVRLDLYRRFSSAENLDHIRELESEIKNRFGKIDEITNQFIQIMMIKTVGKQQKIEKISNSLKIINMQYFNGKSVTLNAPTRDDDDILETILNYLLKKS